MIQHAADTCGNFPCRHFPGDGGRGILFIFKYQSLAKNVHILHVLVDGIRLLHDDKARNMSECNPAAHPLHFALSHQLSDPTQLK